ncbi:MAG: NYN domain-containing protein [Oscillospiraceae bacterium]|nr:NYN domain-containing protein [Oscillospiraceae bacterium]
MADEYLDYTADSEAYEEEETAPAAKTIDYPDSTYMLVSKIGYLLGVPYQNFERGALKLEHYETMDRDKNARIIRNLCIVRNGIEQNYLRIYNAFRNDIKNLHTLPEYIDTNAINQLSADGIQLIKANYPLERYLIDINGHIANRINNCKSLIPIWLKWEYVRALFIMPNGTKPEGIKAAGYEYSSHRNDYPFQVYMNWSRMNQGNILFNDKKFVTLLYEENHDFFQDMSKVTDAGKLAKDGIYSFLDRSESTAIVVDCENSDPYKLYAMLKNLDQNALLSKIKKIILYDDIHASSAWEILGEFTDIPVERIELTRVKEAKSFLDIRLSVGVCREFYENHIDSFILAASDSDYWGLIPTLEQARFLVLVEEEKVSGAIRRAMDDAGITYCYLDDFCTGNSSEIKEHALLLELRKRLENEVNFNIKDMLRDVYDVTMADMTDGERQQFYQRYIKPMHIVIDPDGEVYLHLGEK